MGDEEFKALRHRFYRLGKVRDFSILRDLGKAEDGEGLGHDEMKGVLVSLKDEGRIFDLISAIQHHEEEIQKEKEALESQP